MMSSWLEQLEPIIEEYADGGGPLDRGDVDRLVEIIKAKVNLHQGNITEAESEAAIDGAIK